jgi:hypothetical protein
MKKITLALFALFGTVGNAFGQANINVKAPPYNATTVQRLPNGTSLHKSLKGSFLIKKSELTALTANLINGVGFVRLDGTDPVQSSGNFTLYLENTTDISYSKGTAFNTAVALAQNKYMGAWTTPTAIGTATVMLPLSTPFTYNGDGIYVSYEFEETTPAVNNNTWSATYEANNLGTGNNQGAVSYSNIANGAPNTMTLGDFRPVVVFDATNNATNNAAVADLIAPGIVSKLEGGHNVIARIRNSSTVPLANVQVSLDVTGANSFSDVQTITTINAGAVQTVTFNTFNPTVNGVNTMDVTIPTDDVDENNLSVWQQSVTCDIVSLRPPVAATTFTGYGIGAGASTVGRNFTFRYIPTTSSSSITAVRLVIPPFTNAANLNKLIYPVLLDATGNVVASGNTITITSAMLNNNFATLTFTAPEPLVANTVYHIGAGVPANGYFPIGTWNAFPTSGTVTNFYTSVPSGPPLTNVSYGYFSLEGVLTFTGTSIAASASPVSICKGDSVVLTATGPNGATFTWTPGAALTGSVVTVIPSIAPTQTQVVVNYNVNGTDVVSACPLNGAVASVTVKAGPNVSVASKSICIGSKTVLTPTGAATYSASGGTFNNTAGTSFSITGSAVGVTTYSFAGTNTLGCTSATMSTANVTVSACLGLEDYLNTGAIRIYPNPAVSGVAKISGLNGSTAITVYNTLGQAVLTQTTTDGTAEVDLSNHAPGNYLVRIDNGSEVQTMKLVNQK